MDIAGITGFLEELAPLQLQESYDNAGLLLGNPGNEVSGVLVALDLTEEVLREAIEKKCSLIITHHPLIFRGLKKITGRNSGERIIIEAIKKDIAVYAIHTNLDNVSEGVNKILGDKIGLTNLEILSRRKDMLSKLVTFAPDEDAEKIRSALFEAGAGRLGNYDSCSFNLQGTGTFRGSDKANPYVGERGKLNVEKETRIEAIFPNYLEKKILEALLSAHPYEEVAYDIYPLSNAFPEAGAGMIGELPEEMSDMDFLLHLKKVTGTKCVRHSALTGKMVRQIAFCGGSGSFLIDDAMRRKADVFVTGDVKYHDFFLGEDQMVIADIGHYESEQFVKELIYSELIKKFPNFAVLISEANTNSVKYL